MLLVCGSCGSGGGFPDAAPPDSPPPPGAFHVTWSVSDTSGNPISCDTIGGFAMTATLVDHAVIGGSTQVFTCSSGGGSSQAVDPGTYDIAFELDGAKGVVLATAPTQKNVVIGPGKTVELTPLAFAVDATGGLALNVIAGSGAGGNCAAKASGGAGITSFTLTLAQGSTCQPVTFQVSAGAETASTYTVDCANPQVAGCIEQDQTLSVSDVPSGNYTLMATGFVGSTSCWTVDETIEVPAAAMTFTTPLALELTGTTGC
jgi:hypothetical protein